MDTNEVIRALDAYKDEMMRKQAENARSKRVKTAAALILRVAAENSRRKRAKTAAGVASFLKALPSLSGKVFGKAHDVIRPKRFVVDKAKPNYEHNLPGFHTKQTVDLNGNRWSNMSNIDPVDIKTEIPYPSGTNYFAPSAERAAHRARYPEGSHKAEAEWWKRKVLGPEPPSASTTTYYEAGRPALSQTHIPAGNGKVVLPDRSVNVTKTIPNLHAVDNAVPGSQVRNFDESIHGLRIPKEKDPSQSFVRDEYGAYYPVSVERRLNEPSVAGALGTGLAVGAGGLAYTYPNVIPQGLRDIYNRWRSRQDKR